MDNNTNIDWPAVNKAKCKEYTECADYYAARGAHLTASNFRKLAAMHVSELNETSPAETAPDDDKVYTAKRVLALAVFLITLAAVILGLGLPQ